MTPHQKAKQMLKYHNSKENAIKAVEKKIDNLYKIPDGIEYYRRMTLYLSTIEEIENL